MSESLAKALGNVGDGESLKRSWEAARRPYGGGGMVKERRENDNFDDIRAFANFSAYGQFDTPSLGYDKVCVHSETELWNHYVGSSQDNKIDLAFWKAFRDESDTNSVDVKIEDLIGLKEDKETPMIMHTRLNYVDLWGGRTSKISGKKKSFGSR